MINYSSFFLTATIGTVCSLPTLDAALSVDTDRGVFESRYLTVIDEDFEGTPVQQISTDTETSVGAFSVYYEYVELDFVDGDFLESPKDDLLVRVATPSTIDSSTRELRLNYQKNENFPSEYTKTLQFRFDTPILGFGADWNGIADFGPGPDDAGITLFVNGDTLVLDDILGSAPVSYTTPLEDGGFVGVTSDSPFSVIFLAITGAVGSPDEFILDNAALGSVLVPEPSTWLMLGTCLALGLTRRQLGLVKGS